MLLRFPLSLPTDEAIPSPCQAPGAGAPAVRFLRAAQLGGVAKGPGRACHGCGGSWLEHRLAEKEGSAIKPANQSLQCPAARHHGLLFTNTNARHIKRSNSLLLLRGPYFSTVEALL